MAARTPRLPGTVSLRGFARILGQNLWHVEQLRTAGRLVMAQDGKHVVIESSIARLRETADQPSPTPDQAVTPTRFARILGMSPSYIPQLKAEGRLVSTPVGKRVLVNASIARIEATRDPAKAGVSARHAATRQARAGDAATPAPVAPPASPQRATADTVDADDATGLPPAGEPLDGPEAHDGFQYWRKRNERAKALASERDNAVADGKLLDAGEVTAAVAAAAITLRTRFEGLPDVLGPQLAGVNDEAQARALLAEAIEHALEEASRQFAVMAKVLPA